MFNLFILLSSPCSVNVSPHYSPLGLSKGWDRWKDHFQHKGSRKRLLKTKAILVHFYLGMDRMPGHKKCETFVFTKKIHLHLFLRNLRPARLLEC